MDQNKHIFDALHAQKDEIDHDAIGNGAANECGFVESVVQ
jgi:hypothetical protein